MRTTQSARQAVERLAPLAAEHGIKLRPAKRGCWFAVPRSKLPRVKHSTVRALALATWTLRRLGVEPTGVRWRGRIPLRGLSTWQEDALDYLRRLD